MVDVLIVGGGPGGSTAATLLARRGYQVLLVERESFPRFHIGESLLPYNQPLFEELGVLPILESMGLPRKFGAQFHSADGQHSLKLQFRQGRFTRHPVAFQVERATFDHLLLKNAAAAGAQVQHNCSFVSFSQLPDRIAVTLANSPHSHSTVHARYLIDASGRANVTGNQEGLRVVHPNLKKVALFGHFAQVQTDPGESGGDTVIVRLPRQWFWLIPIGPNKVSVGCVLDRDELQAKVSPRELFDRYVASSPPLRQRLENAQLLGDFHVTSDFSYHNQRLVGDRLLRVGDAAGFMDPIFSAGVYLAMHSAKLAANTVDHALKSGRPNPKSFQSYEREVFRSMRFYWEMVEGFYTAPFLDLFFQPKHRLSLPAAVNAALAGDLSGRWSLRWRMRLFFWLVRLQHRYPIVPKLNIA